MSKGGGASKVYFILYLAVVLELLIIIVDRDEAEEGLLRKQKETMKIVESILSQLQSGAGTEGINTRPQDEITIPPPGIDLKAVMGADIKSFRRYIIEVGVTDVTNELNKKEGESGKDYQLRLAKLVKLANVEDIEYQVFYSSSLDPNNAPSFPNDEEIKRKNFDFLKFTPGQTISAEDGSLWDFLAVRKLKLDEDATYNNLDLKNLSMATIVPAYPHESSVNIGPSFAPSGMPDDSVFFYSTWESSKYIGKAGTGELKKRSFIVNFQPPSKAGWYKLRFASRTNRILGVKGGLKPSEVNDETTVNIGTVQLTVKDLNKVKKELSSKLEKYNLPSYDDFERGTITLDEFDEVLKKAKDRVRTVGAEDVTDVIGKINLYGYICKLLVPGQSSNFDQNKGSIEFNVRVITPTPVTANPVIAFNQDNYACFDQLAPVIDFTISPYQGGNQVEGRVFDKHTNETVAHLTFKARDEVAGTAPPPRGDKREYYAYVDTKLTPGNYSVEITHRLAGKFITQNADLDVFKTGLTNETFVRSHLTFTTNYGNYVTINADPNSGGKIKPNQFYTYLNTDINQQNPPINSYTVTQADNPPFMTANTNSLTMRITWKQPITGTEIDIFPKETFTIKQTPPKINIGDKSVNVSGQERKISIRVSRILVTGTPIGDKPQSSERSDIKVDIGKIDVSNVSGYDLVAGSEVIEKDEGGYYTILFDITGKLPRGEDKVKGMAKVPIVGTAINTINKKVSDPERKEITFQLNYEPEKAGRVPYGGGGGRRPPIK
jgi:hypothetical protein